jgi:hypothetical protein
MTKLTNKMVNVDVVREFVMLYDKGDKVIQRLVDAWHGAKDFGEIDMIECQMETYKKEVMKIAEEWVAHGEN